MGEKIKPVNIDCVREWTGSESCVMEPRKADSDTTCEITTLWHDQLAHVRGSGETESYMSETIEGLNGASVVEPRDGRLNVCGREKKLMVVGFAVIERPVP